MDASEHFWQLGGGWQQIGTVLGVIWLVVQIGGYLKKMRDKALADRDAANAKREAIAAAKALEDQADERQRQTVKELQEGQSAGKLATEKASIEIRESLAIIGKDTKAQTQALADHMLEDDRRFNAFDKRFDNLTEAVSLKHGLIDQISKDVKAIKENGHGNSL